MKRRDFIKRGALFVPTIFIPRLIRAQSILTAPGLASFGSNATTGGGGGGGGDDLTGLALRYKVDDASTVDGGGIGTLPDSGGGGHDATQASGSDQPIMHVGFVNGHKAAEFGPGTGGQFWTASVPATLIGGARSATVFVVLKQDGTQANNGAFNFVNGADTVGSLPTFSDVIYWDWQNTSGGRISGSQPTGWDNAWHVLELHVNGANQSILVDGATIATSSSASGNISQTGTGTLTLGFYAVSFKGFIAEFRFYNSDKDSTSSANIRGALKTTYGT